MEYERIGNNSDPIYPIYKVGITVGRVGFGEVGRGGVGRVG